MGGAHVGDRLAAGKRGGNGLEAGLAQAVELRPALGDQRRSRSGWLAARLLSVSSLIGGEGIQWLSLDALDATRDRDPGRDRSPTCRGSSRSTTARSRTAIATFDVEPRDAGRDDGWLTERDDAPPGARRPTRDGEVVGWASLGAVVAARRLPAHGRGLGLRRRRGARHAASAGELLGALVERARGTRRRTSCWPAIALPNPASIGDPRGARLPLVRHAAPLRREARPDPRRRAAGPAPGRS